jgi:hypothetical protein
MDVSDDSGTQPEELTMEIAVANMATYSTKESIFGNIIACFLDDIGQSADWDGLRFVSF